MDVVARRERGVPPPILTLLDLIEEHRPAFEYDWRTRFGCRLDIPDGMSWGEAWRLMVVLADDPSSHVAASMAGWARPVSREWMILADLFDAFVMANTDTKKHTPTPYPRPSDPKPKKAEPGAGMTVAEYRALRAHIEAPPARPRDERGRFIAAP